MAVSLYCVALVPEPGTASPSRASSESVTLRLLRSFAGSYALALRSCTAFSTR
jgi:hypothetical protein